MRSVLAWKYQTRLAVLAALLIYLTATPQRAICAQRKELHTPGQAAPQMPPVVNLRKVEAIPFSAPGPTAIRSNIKCGPDGDIFAVYTNESQALLSQFNQSGGIFRVPVSRVSISSKKITEYPIPAIAGYYSPSRHSFDVRADGTLFALLRTARNSGSESKRELASLIVEYNDDGTVASYFSVGDVHGRRVQPLSMSAFADGNFLLTGTMLGDQQLGTFTGIFDRQGTFIAPLELRHVSVGESEPPGTEPAPAKPEQTKQPEGGAEKQKPGEEFESMANNPVSLESSTLSVSSADDSVYVLQGTGAATLYAVSPAGYVARRFTLKPPQPGLSPVQMAAAGIGYLFIDYKHIPTGAPDENLHEPEMIEVLNSESGQVTALYRLPDPLADFVVPACANSTDDFLFLGAGKDNHLEVVRYAAP